MPYKSFNAVITTLIESFLRSLEDNLVLIIAGRVMDVSYLESIKKFINENIILKDHFIKEEELQVYFNAADVVVLPFEKIENSGTVILAMGFKKPVIAPKMGVLVKQLSKEKLEQMGENNFQSLSNYKWSDFAKAF